MPGGPAVPCVKDTEAHSLKNIEPECLLVMITSYGLLWNASPAENIVEVL